MNFRLMLFNYLFISVVSPYTVFAQSRKPDVVIYSATASGVMAAIAASREGASVVLFEPGQHLGGMLTGGLSHTDYGDRTVIGGLAIEFYAKVAKHYKTNIFYWRGPEPHVGEKILKDWLTKEKVKVVYNKRLDKVIIKAGSISELVFTDGTNTTGTVFIDAGYEGDLMAKAGVEYTYGREGKKEYNETWAGRQPLTFTSHQIDARLNPFNNDKEKKILPLIKPEPMVEIGEGDKGIQSYCFRMIATDKPDNMISWPKPKNYNPSNFELVKRYYQKRPNAGPLIGFWPTLPNNKSDINSSVGISTNLLDGSSWKYPEAGYELRDSIRQWHVDYTLGLAYFLSNDASVPANVRQAMNTFGLCKDEYQDTGNFPHQLYVREARRMKGEYFMTEHDLTKDTVKYDAVGMGSYNIDVREMQRSFMPISRFPDLKYEVYNEGYLSIPVAQYEIPYRSLIPKFEECQNLLVPVCISGSHLAIASIRMEPQYMIMGQSVGVAAAMAVASKRAVQKIDIYELQKKLKNTRQVISLKENIYGIWNTENEVVIDNNMKGFTSFTGDWIEEETQHTGRYEMNFRYKPKEGTGLFEYNPYLFKSGEYDVFFWYPVSKDYESQIPIEIHHAKGTDKIFINQQKGGGKWVKVGTYSLNKGKNRVIVVQGELGKYVIADAVKFQYLR